MRGIEGSGSDAGGRGAFVRGRSKSGPQVQRLDPEKSWTPEVQARFLAELAVVCNVAMAAEAVGFSPATCYYHRRMDADFARQWDVAKEEAAARIELALLRAAEESLTRPVSVNAGDVPEPNFGRLSIDQAIAVVRMLRNRDGNGDGSRSRRHWHWTPMDPEKAKEAILRAVDTVIRARALPQPA